MLGTVPALRPAAIGCRLPFLTPCAYHTSSTTPTPRRSKDCSTTQPRRRAPLAKRNVSFKSSISTSLVPIRYTSSVSTPPSSSQTDSAASQTSPEILDWNTFFKLRKTRRWYQLGSSIGTGVNGFILGAQVLTRSDMDALVSQIPLDPFITLGLITFTCGGIGWLAGPIVGTAFFNWKNKKYRAQMDEKEKEFYKRIKKYRVDPSASSMANPVPDYYGEKIGSVADYRRWLKDQRAFNKKRTTYIKY